MHRLTSFLLLLLPLFSLSQVNIVNHSLADSSLNIVYTAIDNKIELMGIKTKNNSLSYSVTNGIVTNFDQNKCMLRVLQGEECTLSFFNKGKLVTKKSFKVLSIADPIARFSNYNDSIIKGNTTYLTISLSKLNNDPVLRVIIPDYFLRIKAEIVSYRITIDGPGFDDEDEILVVGSKLTDDQVKLITRRTRNGNFMAVDNIRCHFPDGRTRLLIPLLYYVTN